MQKCEFTGRIQGRQDMADKMDEIIITPRDIARIVELNKQRAELIFRKSYANNASLNVTIDKELSIIEASLSSFNEKLKRQEWSWCSQTASLSPGFPSR